jgi:succinate dehydrogenase / fumarate reductase, cytochrome b subunit
VNPLIRFLTSSIGRKWVVALTGLVLFGFVVGHLIGNLQIFLGWEALNRYGAFLQGTGELLWVVRLGLIVMIVLHIIFTIKLRAENRGAKEQRYAVTQYRATSLAARWMTLSGLMVFCFIIYHLLHFTVQVPAVNFISPALDFTELHDAKARHDVYGMMIRGFQVWYVSLFYLIGVGLLALHLNHGIMSMGQTLGANTGKLRPLWEKGGPAFSFLIFLGYASIPVAVMCGVFGK